MTSPINLSNFRAITGGDAELDAELFRSFFSSSDEFIGGLRKAFQTGEESLWLEHAHGFKGTSFNIGADHLGDLCKTAEDSYKALPKEKEDIIVAIENEFALVRAAIESLSNI